MATSVILASGREKSLQRKHPWIFAGAVERVKGRVNAGDTVDVISHKGKWLGRGAYSPESQIRMRIWTFDKDEKIDNVFFIKKIQQALLSRQHLIKSQVTNAYRLVAAESDSLPGITIDQYDDILVMQLLSTGAEKHKDKIIWALEKCFPEHRIYERSDVAVREKEGLEQRSGAIKGQDFAPVTIVENNIKIQVDVTTGHKTGFYLDQRDSRKLAARYMQDASVLNCFAYTGTFGIYALKAGAKSIVNVDVSEQALAMAKSNYKLNDCDASAVEFVQADVFNYLRDCVDKQQRFDHIILDPPKFVDSKASLKRAARGYKDINLQALKCINQGGYLSSFSCSGLMDADLFYKIVADAALDANRQVKILHRYYQAPDHGVSSNFPEGFYLKGVLAQVF